MSSQIPIIAANWKMNKTPQEAHFFVEELKDRLYHLDNIEVILCPSFPALFNVGKLLINTKISLAAQNMFWERQGAFTGEVSASMLKACNVSWVILGHSERRHIFGETNEGILKKVKMALGEELNPILCIGETLDERQRGKTHAVVTQQLAPILESADSTNISRITLAYEPVWAIGTGVNAKEDQIEEAHGFIQELIHQHTSLQDKAIRILYGGSVTSENSSSLIQVRGVDGFLVGGASLNVESFVTICENAEKKQLGVSLSQKQK